MTPFQMRADRSTVNGRLLTATCILLIALTGCSSKPQLMATPNLYAMGYMDPFPDVPAELRSNRVEVLYVTDRALEEGATPEAAAYGHKRSRSLAFGVAEVQFGADDVTWDQLVQASTSAKREVKLEMAVTKTTELARFPQSPRSVLAAESSTAMEIEQDAQRSLEITRQEIVSRLAKSPVKDIYIFVHGVKTGFGGAIQTMAEMWHFLGRGGVPLAYTWPAGGKGALRGYNYDYNSSEFTVYHFKQTLRTLAAIPEVNRIHIIGHSRGTDVIVSGIRELNLEFIGAEKSTRDELKLATVVLAAPDLDVDVMFQRAATSRLAFIPERTALYICAEDNALAFSRFLFGGMRLGKLQPEVFSAAELEGLRKSSTVSFVDARVAKPGSFGHNYFYSNPAVSSDLILLVRYGRVAGAQFGRPLESEESGFWIINDEYPNLKPSGLKLSEKKEIAMQLVSTAENSSLEWKKQYGYIEYNVEHNDAENRGYTAGIIGFTSRTHDMLELVEHYEIAAPGNVLSKYLPALRKVDGTSSTEGLGDEYMRDWKLAAQDPKFQEAQNHERDRVYFNPAVDRAQGDGLGTLGQFIYYDAIVMHGDGNDPASFRNTRANAMKVAKTPAQGGDETAYLHAFLDARKAAMLMEQGHQNTTRVDTAQRVFLNEGNLNLDPPLRFKVYGDSFEILP